MITILQVIMTACTAIHCLCLGSGLSVYTLQVVQVLWSQRGK